MPNPQARAPTSLPSTVVRALRCAPAIDYRNWREIPLGNLTRAETVMAFIEAYLRVPEGKLVGQPLRLEPFQEAFLYAIYDNPHGTSSAYLSMGRKNGKTALIAGLLLAHIVGPEAVLNSQIISGAMSRDQAALVFRLASKMISLNEELHSKCGVVPSYKSITGVARGVEYKALSADASTAHGLSPRVAILDEVGQIVGPHSDFIDAITTAQGAYDDALVITISTSARSDADLLSVWCDDAERSGDKHTVCMVFEAEEWCDLLDEEQWAAANPALDVFRSREDLRKQLEKAARIPSEEAKARNLLLNQRVAMEGLWLAPSAWRDNAGEIDLDVFRERPVAMGLDLSARQDLTAAVLAAQDADSNVHLLPYVFTPAGSLEERAKRDRAPYVEWFRSGHLIALPGTSLDYDMICEYLSDVLRKEEIHVNSVEFDRWRIEDFKSSAADFGIGEANIPNWNAVGQGFRDFSPRLEAFENLLLEGQIRHGGHPLLTMAASNAVAIRDPAGNSKLDKSKTTQRIDPLVAAVMAAYAVTEGVRRTRSMYEDETRTLIM